MRGKRLWILAVLVLLAAVAAGGAIRADSASVLLEQAIYTEETVGDLDRAIKLYQSIVADAQTQREYVAQAHYRLGVCYAKKGDNQKAAAVLREVVATYSGQQNVVAAARAELDRLADTGEVFAAGDLPDPASLMPPETLFYMELGNPGVQLGKVLGMLEGTGYANPLALMAGGMPRGGNNPSAALAALLNPSMMKEFRKIRGFAIGVHDVVIEEQQAQVLGVFYPGESDALRGVLTAALFMAARPGESIEGMQTLRFDGDPILGCAMDEKALLFAVPAEKLAWMVRQYKAASPEPSLLSSHEGFVDLTASARQQNAMTAWWDPARTAQAVRAISAHSPDFQAAFQVVDAFFDFSSMRQVTLRQYIEEGTIGHDLTLSYRPDHSAFGFNIYRTPHLSASAFRAVPQEAVAVAALSLGDQVAEKLSSVEGVGRALQQAPGSQDLLGMVDAVTMFLLPPERADTVPGNMTMPGVGLAIMSARPEEAERLIAQWLTAAHQAHGGSPQVPAGGPYTVGVVGTEPMNVYTGCVGDGVVLSLSPSTIELCRQAAASGRSMATGGVLHDRLAQLPQSTSKWLAVNVRSVLSIARHQLAMQNVAAAPQLEAMANLADAFGKTVIEVRSDEEPLKVTLHGAVEELAPLSELIPAIARAAQTFQQLEPVSREPEPASLAYALEPIMVDGDLGEWGNIDPMPRPFQGAEASSVRLAWRQEGLYGAVRARDERIAVNSAEPWKGDSFELFLDKAYSRSNFQGKDAAQYVFAPEGEPGAALNMIAWGGSTDEAAQLKCAWRRTGNGYALEFLIPVNILRPAKMEVGTRMGLNFALNDDGEPVEQFYADKQANESYYRPVTWGAVVLTRFDRLARELHQGAAAGDAARVRAQLSRGVDPVAQDEDGRTPLFKAAEAGHADVVALLARQPEALEAERKQGQALRVAAHNGHADALAVLLEAGVDPELQDDHGRRALHWAAKFNHLDCVELLLEHGADIEARDENNWSPLFMACMDGSIDTARHLVEHGAQVNLTTVHGETPLSRAKQEGHRALVAFLREHGAD